METFIVVSVLRALGKHEGFRERFGGGLVQPEQAVLHAIEHEAEVLPSFQRLDDHNKQLVTNALQAYFPLEMFITTEAVPAHMDKAKNSIANLESGMQFFVAALLIDHLVLTRSILD